MKKIVTLLVIPLLIFLVACGGGAPPPPSGEPTPPSTGAEVIIEGFAFQPATLTVAKGGVVTWVNRDSTPHTVVGEGFESPRLNKGDSWSHTFDTPGTFDYHCGLHPSMTGQIVVE